MRSLFKTVVAALLVCAVVLMSSCTSLLTSKIIVKNKVEEDTSETASIAFERTFAVGNCGVEVAADGNWDKVDADGIDLQLENDDIGAYLYITVYYRVDLAEEMTAERAFNAQNEIFFETYENVCAVNETEVKSSDTRSVLANTTSAECDGIENYYRSYMIDQADSDKLVWVLINSMPSTMDKNQEYFDCIVDKITVE